MKTRIHHLIMLTTAFSSPLLGQDEQRRIPPPPREPGAPQSGGERGGPPAERRSSPGERIDGGGDRRPEDAKHGRHEDGLGRPDRPDGPPALSRPPRPAKPTPFLGLITDRIPPALGAQLGLPEGFGLVVEQVFPDSPAAAAGVQQFDVVKLFNDQQIVDPGQLSLLVRRAGKDTEVTLSLLRKSQEQKVTVKIGERMMPEPRTFGTPSGDILRNLHERVEEHTKRFREIPQTLPNLLPDSSTRELQDRVRGFHDKVKEWTNRPGVGSPPQLPDVVSHADAGVSATNVLGIGSARVVVTDPDGELEVRSENGRRTIIAKNPAGEIMVSKSIDTEEQRDTLPEAIRKKLRRIEAQSTTAGGRSSASASSVPEGNAGPVTIPLEAPEREIQ